MVVTTMAVGAAIVLSTEIQGQAKRAQLVQAEVSAQSVLELAALTFPNTEAARTEMAQGTAVVVARVGGLKSMVMATAPDGKPISPSPADAFVLVSRAEGAHASQGVKIGVAPVSTRVTSFDSAIHAGGRLGFSGSTVTGGPTVGAHGQVVAATSTVAVPAYSASSTVSGTTFTAGTSTSDGKIMPSASCIEYYAALATPIKYSAAGGKIRRCVLGAGVNPFGTASASGIYSIDCGGETLDIEDCRIVGTLVVLNSVRVRIRGNVHWTTASPDLPILVMRGPLNSTISAGGVFESAIGVNFTPPALPFEGVSNTTTTDVLPGALQGVMYVDGDATIENAFSLEGSLVCTGRVTFTGANASIARHTNMTIPAGFKAFTLEASGGSERVVR
jgi:hypothetical protein